MFALLMEKLIGKLPSDIEVLNLSRCNSKEIEGLDSTFVNLQELDLSFAGLTTLKNFPALPNLRTLKLDGNNITGSLEYILKCPKLDYLSIDDSDLKSIDALKPLAKLPRLKRLRADFIEVDDYYDQIFNLLENLKYLNGFDRDGGEDEGDFEEEFGSDAQQESDDLDDAKDDVSSEDNDADDVKNENTSESEVGAKPGGKRAAEKSEDEPKAKHTNPCPKGEESEESIDGNSDEA